jgi:Zn-dependent M16 (insulinase) family peptidase
VHSGEDAGVVYSEMQGRENLPFSVMALKQQRALYPEGSAYRSETGGLMDALRVLNIDQIRDYHGSYYLPHNLCLFATGKIDPEKLLKVLQDEVEPSIIKHNQDRGRKPEGWKRPFVETPSKNPPHIAKDRTEVVEFPEKDESQYFGQYMLVSVRKLIVRCAGMGEVSLSWVGVSAGDYLTDKAIDILNAYLSDSAISPLQKALVEIDDPYATDIGFDTFDQYTTVINLNLQSVPSEKLESAGEEVKKVLKSVVEQGIDMERMHMVLNREQRRVRRSLLFQFASSSTKHHYLSSCLIRLRKMHPMLLRQPFYLTFSLLPKTVRIYRSHLMT